MTEINIDNNIYGIESSTIAKPKETEAQEQEQKEAVTQPAEPQKRSVEGANVKNRLTFQRLLN